MNKVPSECPSCKGELVATELRCKKCLTTIKGEFPLPVIASLDSEDEIFLKVFLGTRGNIKEVEKQLDISYPTVRNKLDHLIHALGLGGPRPELSQKRLEILEQLEKGELKTAEALRLLKEMGKDIL